jgi:hypothetical protein
VNKDRAGSRDHANRQGDQRRDGMSLHHSSAERSSLPNTLHPVQSNFCKTNEWSVVF